MEKNTAQATSASEMSEKNELEKSASEERVDVENVATTTVPPATMAAPAPEDSTPQLPKKQRAIMCLALALGVFLISIDETVIVTAIPRITDDFRTIQDVGWYGSAYLLSMCAFQLHCGKFYKDYSAKWVFLGAVGIFELGSLVCGVAPSSDLLIFGRAVSGAGACGIVSGVLILIARMVPLRERPLYTAGVSSVRIVAGVGGPLLGGAFTDSKLTWRWCFYINLPFGAAVAAIFFIYYRPPPEQHAEVGTKEKLKRLDLPGLLLFFGSMICLIFALQFGGSSGTWNTPAIIVLFTFFGVFLLGFAAYESWLGETATVPPRIAENRTVLSASFFVLTIDAPYYAIVYFIPIYFQVVLRTSPLESGIRSIPQLVGALVFSLLAGTFIRKTGFFAPVVAASIIITTVACGLLSLLRPNSGPGMWISFQLLVGIGIGLGMQQAAVMVQQTLEQEDIPLGIAAVTFCQASGPAIMVSVAQSVFAQRLAGNLEGKISGLSGSVIYNTGATKLTALVPASQEVTVINAVNRALVWVWYSCTIMAALSVLGAAEMDWRKLNQLRSK